MSGVTKNPIVTGLALGALTGGLGSAAMFGGSGAALGAGIGGAVGAGAGSLVGSLQSRGIRALPPVRARVQLLLRPGLLLRSGGVADSVATLLQAVLN